ncbi:MAG: FkbM family methyltransferase [Pseudomonadota bacterium]
MIQTLSKAVLNAVPPGARRRLRGAPVIGPIQRAVFSALFDGREFDHVVDAGPAKGVAFRIRLPEDKGVWTGGYEAAFAEAVAAAMRARAGRPAFDVGGWHGYFSGVLAANGASAVHVFEPLAENQRRLERLIALNPARAIALHPVAVGDHDGEATLVVMPDSSMAKLSDSAFQTDAASRDQARVTLRSLDSLIASGAAPEPALIKLDVEGAELAALTGAAALIERAKPAIFLEAHSGALRRDCEAFLTERGYRIKSLDEDPAAARRRDVHQLSAVAA